jgi:membrane protein implicated in regulation of membrane protease activity
MIDLISYGITALGLFISWGLYRRRGAASGMRGAALSLVPAAAAMTGVTEFVTDLAFSPVKWAGVVLAGLAVLLYLTSGVMLSRRAAADGEVSEGKRAKQAKAPKAPKGAVEKGGASAGLDPDLADIEEILRNRGIK